MPQPPQILTSAAAGSLAHGSQRRHPSIAVAQPARAGPCCCSDSDRWPVWVCCLSQYLQRSSLQAPATTQCSARRATSRRVFNWPRCPRWCYAALDGGGRLLCSRQGIYTIIRVPLYTGIFKYQIHKINLCIVHEPWSVVDLQRVMYLYSTRMKL